MSRSKVVKQGNGGVRNGQPRLRAELQTKDYLILRSCLIAACISSSERPFSRRMLRSRKKNPPLPSDASSTVVEYARPSLRAAGAPSGSLAERCRSRSANGTSCGRKLVWNGRGECAFGGGCS